MTNVAQASAEDRAEAEASATAPAKASLNRPTVHVEGALANDAMAAARGGTSLIVFQSMARVLSLVFVAVVTRRLGPSEFGRFSIVAAVVIFANLLADFGTSTAMTRLVSRKPEEADDLLAATLPASLALGFAAYAVALGFAALVYPTQTVIDVAIGGLAIPCASVLSSVLGALDGAGLIARRAFLTCLQTTIVSLGAVAVLFGAGVRVAVAMLAAAPMIVLFLACLIARRAGVWHSHVRFEPGRIRTLARAAIPFAVTGGLTALTLRFDVLLLSVLKPPAETATYDVALRLVEATSYLSFAVCGPMLFILNRRIAGGDREGAIRAYAEGGRVLYVLGLPLSIALAVLARPIVSAAFGEGFDAAVTPVAVMGAGMWLTFVISVQGSLVMASDHVARGVCVALLNAAVVVLLDLVLLPRYGAAGAAVAMVASWTFAVMAFDVFHRRVTRMPTPLPPLRVVISATLAGFVLFALRNEGIAVAALAGTITYALALVVLREVGGRDFYRLRSVISRRLA